MKKISIVFTLCSIFSIFMLHDTSAGNKKRKNIPYTNLSNKKINNPIDTYRRNIGKNNIAQDIQPKFHFSPNLDLTRKNVFASTLLCLLIIDQLALFELPETSTTPDQTKSAINENKPIDVGVTTLNKPILMITEPIPHNLKSQLYHHLEHEYRNHEYCDYFLDGDLQKYKKEYKVLEKRIKKPTHINPEFCTKIDEKFKKNNKLDKIMVDVSDNKNFNIVSESFYKIANSGYLVTSGISKCVSIAIFNPETNTSGMAHISGENIMDIDNNLSSKEKKDYLSGIQEFLGLVLGETDPSLLEITLLGGFKPNIEYCSEFLKQFGFDKINVIYNKNWDQDYKELNGGSLMIKSDTGEIYAIKNNIEVWKKMKPADRKKPKRLSLEND